MSLFFIVIVVFLFVVSGYFSACETAITAASRAELHHLAKEGDKRASIICFLQGQLGLVVSIMLMCTTMLNFCIATLAGDHFGVVGSFIMGSLVLLYAEVMPKMLALLVPEAFLLKSARFLNVIFLLFKPFNLVINFIASLTLRLFGVNAGFNNHHHASIEELKGLIDLHKGPGVDVPHERAMLKSILDLGSVQIKEVMIHRKDLVTIDASLKVSTIVSEVLSSPYTRFPVWQGSPEHIIGIINAKVLFRYVNSYAGNIDELSIVDVCTPPWFIPESTDLLHQLQAFRSRREHFALVVDEYGTLLGSVALEDILEEIVGDIQDEHDTRIRGIRKHPDGSYVVHGDVTIRDLNRQFDWNLPDEEASTVAGLLLFESRIIPHLAQVFVLYGFRFEVLKKHRNRISLIRVTPLSAGPTVSK